MINEEIKQDVWDLLDENSVLCVLTNDTVVKTYNPIYNEDYIYNPMGAGIAGECKRRNPKFPEYVGLGILRNKRECGVDKDTGAVLFRFSTKRQIEDCKSDLALIEQSLKDLVKYMVVNPDKKVYLPRPGCGIGGLDWEIDVKPLVEEYVGNFNNIYIVSK